MKLANLLRKRKKERRNMEAGSNPKLASYLQISPDQGKPDPRISNETSQSSDLSIIKRSKKDNMVRIHNNVEPFFNIDEDDHTPQRKSTEDISPLILDYKICKQYYFPATKDCLDTLISQNGQTIPKIAIPEFAEVYDKGASYDMSDLFQSTGMERYSSEEKALLLLHAYKHNLFETSFEKSLYHRFIMYIFERHIFRPIHEKVLVPVIKATKKDTESLVHTSKIKKGLFRLKNKEKLAKEFEVEELKKYIKKIRRTKRLLKKAMMQSSIQGKRVQDFKNLIQEAEDWVTVPKHEKVYIKTCEKRIKEAEKHSKEFESLATSMRVVHHLTLEADRIGNPVVYHTEPEPTIDALRQIGFHSLATQWCQLSK
ncbi:unnamed protein product [Moneuplotes crassus]|uniref:Uncharacterized protein n=1 Tax=Euplotes crassus TaxID=5936 RepID=A0AAD1UJD1_EUPCR|nr:unnamed protein product [Moneuplotes crassus]